MNKEVGFAADVTEVRMPDNWTVKIHTEEDYALLCEVK